MPEGHTIHRAAAHQRALFGGKAVRASSPQGRFAAGAALIDGCVLREIHARGKHLFYDFGEDRWLHVHLGLFGRFRGGRGEAPPIRGAVRLLLVADDAWLTLSGPTICEVVDGATKRRVLARIGADPLDTNARPANVLARVAKSAQPLGQLLMDQSVVGGIGNVYRAELLFRAGLSPWTPGRDVDPAALRALWRDARAQLRAGVDAGRIVTTDPADRRRASDKYYVYHRTGKPCRRCGETVRSASLANRTVYWCPVCQPGPEPTPAARPRRRTEPPPQSRPVRHGTRPRAAG